MTAFAVRYEHIAKRFLGVQALDDVSLSVAEGSCHALCGENGAGKSTLGKVLAGIHSPDAGQLFVHDREVRFASPRDALGAGVGMVHQELAFCENMTVAENLLLGAIPARRGFVKQDELERRATEMLANIGADLDVTLPMSKLTIAQQQLVQIATAVSGGAKIIVFDEPTSSLSQAEADRLYALIERLKASGVTCIYVSHRMPEIFLLCDTVSVLRDGKHVATKPIGEITESDLVTLMIGRSLGDYLPQSAAVATGPELLRADRLTVPGKFRDVSFSLRAGEIVGLAGLVGAGRSEIAQTLFGLDAPSSGTISIDGKPVVIGSPKTAMSFGIGLVPEDR
jgi:ABC-type sugar transport system ATPase subunit